MDFKKGDYLVHANYGVGKISKVETKSIGDEKKKYFTVAGEGSTFFVPTENINPERIRPIASDYLLKKVTKILKDEAEVMSDDHNMRKKYINEIISTPSLENAVALYRDLKMRKILLKLNDFEETILNKVKNNLVKEWSIVKDWEKEVTEEKIEDIFMNSHKV